ADGPQRTATPRGLTEVAYVVRSTTAVRGRSLARKPVQLPTGHELRRQRQHWPSGNWGRAKAMKATLTSDGPTEMDFGTREVWVTAELVSALTILGRDPWSAMRRRGVEPDLNYSGPGYLADDMLFLSVQNSSVCRKHFAIRREASASGGVTFLLAT